LILKAQPRKLLSIAIAGIFASAPISSAYAIAHEASGLDRLLKAGRNTEERVRLSPVREAALRASARTLGTQTGLIEQAKLITTAINLRREKMERAFRFGDLVIGAGVLPPVLVKTENAATVQNDVMRLAGAVYQIKQPARFFTGAPSWRDWLLMGLPDDFDPPEIPSDEQLLPRDEEERRFWEQEVKAAYKSGTSQAKEIFEHNLSLLEEVYSGMRTFYELYQRNMVSAPIIAQAQQIVTQDDPNTIVVGDTLFRITLPAQFKTDHEKWRALTAETLKHPRLPIAKGFDPEQVREAYAIYQQQLANRVSKQKPPATEKPAQVAAKARREPVPGQLPEPASQPVRPVARKLPVVTIKPIDSSSTRGAPLSAPPRTPVAPAPQHDAQVVLRYRITAEGGVIPLFKTPSMGASNLVAAADKVSPVRAVSSARQGAVSAQSTARPLRPGAQLFSRPSK